MAIRVRKANSLILKFLTKNIRAIRMIRVRKS